MTEAEWLTATEPGPMLEYLRGKASDRRLRLYTCADCRRYWYHDASTSARHSLEVAELFVDELASSQELNAAFSEASSADSVDGTITSNASAQIAGDGAIEAAYMIVNCVSHSVSKSERKDAIDEEYRIQVGIARDIFGNPFRPVAFAPEWRTAAAVALAESMYQARDFAAMPILADALQDAGCENEDILSHCRGLGPHVRGCWVVDLVTGRE